jgi:hypothetical protein
MLVGRMRERQGKLPIIPFHGHFIARPLLLQSIESRNMYALDAISFNSLRTLAYWTVDGMV